MRRQPIARGGKLSLVRRKDSPFWWVSGTLGGRRYRQSTGCTEKADAEELRVRWEQEHHDKRIYGEEATITFAEAVEDYARTGRDTRFLEPLLDYFGITPILHITPRQAMAAGRTIYPNASNSTLNRQITTPVSAVINLALSGSGREKRHFPRLPEPKGRLRWLQPEEAEALVEACQSGGGTSGTGDLSVMVQALLGSGMRRGELFAMQRRDLHLRAGQVFVPFEKAGDGRMVPLPSRSIRALEAVSDRVGPVWRTAQGRVYSKRTHGSGWSWAAFRSAVERAGLESVTPHTLRHTYATWYAAQAKDLVKLQANGGWERLSTLQRYAKAAPTDLGERLLEFGWDFRSGPSGPEWHGIGTRAGLGRENTR